MSSIYVKPGHEQMYFSSQEIHLFIWLLCWATKVEENIFIYIVIIDCLVASPDALSCPLYSNLGVMHEVALDYI